MENRLRMLPTTLWALCLTAITQATTTASTNLFSRSLATISDPSTRQFTGTQYTYLSYSSQSSLSSSNTTHSPTTSPSSSSQTDTTTTTTTTTTGSVTQLVGDAPSTNRTSSTSTSTANRAQNTIPCNNHPSFCYRQYSNITTVCSHNSAFVLPNNVASNQYYPIVDQLDDGVRMLQGETHLVNNTIYNCHTSCSLLNAGPFQSSLSLLASWIRDHPYDVVTWLIVNSDLVDVSNYVPAIQNSGIAPYLYVPPKIPLHRSEWPTLGEMILSGKRVVLFMDYNANQTAVPYILDEFAHMWETPFSPTNRSFPCTLQRPPRLQSKQAKAQEEFMYLANHNLNTAVDVAAILGSASSSSSDDQILIPNTADINKTNGQQDKFGQLERMRLQCESEWERPPNFLLVDYYNFGHPEPGSVFEVAARANGVEWDHQCCGPKASLAGRMKGVSLGLVVLAVVVAVVLVEV